MEESIIIENGGKLVMELVISEDTYAIKMNSGVHRVISGKKFNSIINQARANGYDVFDYTGW